ILRIIKDRKIKLISLRLKSDRKDWDDVNHQFKLTYQNYVQSNINLLKQKEKAYRIIGEFDIEVIDFSLQQFETSFRGKKVSQITVKEFWKEKVDDLNRAGRTGNAKVYYETMTSFFKYAKNNKLMFKD